ncbi:hypothetical protein WDQ52_001389 [Salmonella enterica]
MQQEENVLGINGPAGIGLFLIALNWKGYFHVIDFDAPFCAPCFNFVVLSCSMSEVNF